MHEDAKQLPMTERAGTRSGCTASEDDIRRLVVAFYAAAGGDDLIGPIFEEMVGDWDAHYDKMCDFWSSAVLKTGRYSGRPASKHFELGLSEAHFARWLSLWERIAREELGEEKSEPFVDMGHRMARSMMNVTGMLN